MTMLKIAFAQINFRPAFFSNQHDLLIEPVFQSPKHNHSSISTMSYQGVDKVKKTLKEQYISWMRTKVTAILSKAIELEVDIIVFPEYSIPVELLEDICEVTVASNIVVVAGTHIVTRNIPEVLKDYPRVDGIVKHAMCPVIRNGKIVFTTLKTHRAKEEVHDLKIPSNETEDTFDFTDFLLQVRICIEGITGGGALRPDHKKIVAIPALSSNSEAFSSLGVLGKYNELPVIYCNCAEYSGSAIFGPFSQNSPHWFVEGFQTKKMSKNVEMLVTATINLDSFHQAVGTVNTHPAVEVGEVVNIYYRKDPLHAQLIRSIDDFVKSDLIKEMECPKGIDELLALKMKKLQLDIINGTLERLDAEHLLQYISINTDRLSTLNYNQANEASKRLAGNYTNASTESNYHSTIIALSEYIQAKGNTTQDEVDFSKDDSLFYGRDYERSYISRFIDSENAILYIHGLQGSGKTKLVNSIDSKIMPPDHPWSIKHISFDTGIGYEQILDTIVYEFNIRYIDRTHKTPEYLADKYLSYIKQNNGTIIIIDNFQNCLSKNGNFADERVRMFVLKLLGCVQTIENVKIILSSNRKNKDISNLDHNALDISKLEDMYIESIISYCYRALSGELKAPKLTKEIIQLAYGNPLAAILIAQLIKDDKISDFKQTGEIFKRYKEGLMARFVDEVPLSDTEMELMKVISVSKGELHVDFLNEHFAHLKRCIETLINRMFIEKSNDCLQIHQIFSDYYYQTMSLADRVAIHKKYAHYFEELHNQKKNNPTMLANVVYHLSGSLQKEKLSAFKGAYIEQLNPIADSLYAEKRYSDALSYYTEIYRNIGEVRTDILMKLCICYVSTQDIDSSKKFFNLAVKQNPRGAYMWADYAIALSNGKRYLKEALHYAQEGEKIYLKYRNTMPWENAKLNFAFAKIYMFDDYSRALEYIQIACDLEPTNMYYLCMRISWLMKYPDGFSAEYIQVLYKNAEIINPNYRFLLTLKEKLYPGSEPATSGL